MKKQFIAEVARMQKLAGITEAKVVPYPSSNIKDFLNANLNGFKNFLKSKLGDDKNPDEKDKIMKIIDDISGVDYDGSDIDVSPYWDQDAGYDEFPLGFGISFNFAEDSESIKQDNDYSNIEYARIRGRDLIYAVWDV
jgi:hypothetical protein